MCVRNRVIINLLNVLLPVRRDLIALLGTNFVQVSVWIQFLSFIQFQFLLMKCTNVLCSGGILSKKLLGHTMNAGCVRMYVRVDLLRNLLLRRPSTEVKTTGDRKIVLCPHSYCFRDDKHEISICSVNIISFLCLEYRLRLEKALQAGCHGNVTRYVK